MSIYILKVSDQYRTEPRPSVSISSLGFYTLESAIKYVENTWKTAEKIDEKTYKHKYEFGFIMINITEIQMEDKL